MIESIQGFSILRLDPQGIIQTWSEGARRIHGYRAEEIVGRHFQDFCPESMRARECARELEIAEREGRFECEGYRLRKDGTRYWAEVAISPMRDDQGKLVGFVQVIRDLSERQVAEEKLRQSEQRFRLLLESVRDYAIFTLDPEGYIQTWSAGAQRIKGYRPEEIIGQHFSRFYTDADRKAGRPKMLMDLAAREGRVEDEGWRVRKDGTRFWADAVLSAMRDESGKLLGFAKVTRDLSERRLAEVERLKLAQAEEAIRLRDEFLSIASHELKTPLTAMRLQLQSLAERLAEDARSARKVDRAVKSTERLDELIETLLDVSRISTGRLQLEPEPLSLNQLVTEVTELLRDAAQSAGCDLIVQADAEVHGVWDHLRLEQVVTNLLTNALKYSPSRPIEVHLGLRGGNAELQVCDRGPGVAEADRERIFSRFERAASLRHYGGMGLGLYVTREIVVAHGGQVQVASREGGGAVFTVTLPLKPRQAGATRRGEPGHAPEGSRLDGQ